jgi:hypothetical protein
MARKRWPSSVWVFRPGPGWISFSKARRADEKFVPRAPNGKLAAELGERLKDLPEFAVFDQNGQRRVAIGVLWDGSPFVSLFDQYGKRRIDFGVLEDGKPRFEFYADRKSQRGITLQVSAADTLSLAVFDSADKGRAALGVDTDGKAAFDLYHSTGKTRIALAVLQDGHAGLGLVDQNGEPIWHELQYGVTSSWSAELPAARGIPFRPPNWSRVQVIDCHRPILLRRDIGRHA